MDFIMDFILHIDHYMVEMVQQYHTWTYAILFAVIFVRRGWWSRPFCRAIPCFLWEGPLPLFPLFRSMSIYCS